MINDKPERENFRIKDEEKQVSLRCIRAELTVLVLIFILAAALLVGYTVAKNNLADYVQGARPVGEIEAVQAAEIAERGRLLLDLEETNAAWAGFLVSGQAELADYLLRLFISPDYLSRQADDNQFISDAFYVLTGDSPETPVFTEAAALLSDSGSRLSLLNFFLAELGYGSRLQLPAAPTRLRTFYLAEDRPQPGAEVVGKIVFAAEARLTGSQARLKLYVDGKIRESRDIDPTDPAMLNPYQLIWDTRREQPGSKRLALLFLTNDGRGHWQEISTYKVPRVTALETGVLQQVTLRAGTGPENNTWFQLPAQGNDALLNILPAAADVNLELLDLYNQPLAGNRSNKDSPMALRFRPSDEYAEKEETVYYVRVWPVRDLADGSEATVTLLPSLAVAREKAQPQLWVPVFSIEQDRLQIPDESGRPVWQDRAGFELYDATARLIGLRLSRGGNNLSFVPEFSREDQFYALVADSQTDELEVQAITMEGSSASVRIRNLTEHDPDPEYLPTNLARLSSSVNRLLLEVSGYDGTIRTYEVNVLLPPHSGGFDLVLNQFPYTYQSWLWLLHLQRPEYQFTADQTGIDWTEFVDAQNERDRSLIDAATVPATWVKPDSPVYDGVSWKAASRPVVAHYGDPRNFLDQANIFQFERMTYDPQIHDRAGIEAILRDTFMEAGNPENIDYAELLIRAAQQADISPFFLASKIIQEMGRLGQSPLAFGQLEGYEGAYNFYNINSIPNPEVPDGARINGARFALYGSNPDTGELSPQEQAWLLPWNTPERAIAGGAIWIAERYVRIGQDTLYLQKFDLIGSNGLFMRQYAQNIQMAWAEGLRTYRAYAEMELLDQPFNFRIPVFDNMPPEPQKLP